MSVSADKAVMDGEPMATNGKLRVLSANQASEQALTTKKPVDQKSIFVIPIANIKEYDNPRHEPARLHEQGYTLFGDPAIEEPAKNKYVSLVHLALSEDIEKAKRYVELIEKYESVDRETDNRSPQTIVELAEDLKLYKQMLPILVRRHRNVFSMGDGGRRVAAILYLHAKSRVNGDKHIYPATVMATDLECKDDELFMMSIKVNLSRKGFTELQEGRVYHEMLKRINPATGKRYNAKEAAAELNVGYGTFRNREALWHKPHKGKGLTDEERQKVASGKMNASYASKKSLGEKVEGDGKRKTTKRRGLSYKEMEQLFDKCPPANKERRQAIADCMGVKLEKAVKDSMARAEAIVERQERKVNRKGGKAA